MYGFPAATSHGTQVSQGQIRGQQRLTTADTDATESQGCHIGGIVFRIGERQAVGHRWPVIVLFRRAIETTPVTAAIDKQAGPVAGTAGATTGREAAAINLGSGIAER